MSETPHSQKSHGKPAKGLGRGLGSLLGNSPNGAFSKTAPGGEKAFEALTSKLNSQTPSALQQGFIEKPEETAAQAETAPSVPAHLRVWQLPIEKIFPNANQPRQVFDKEALEELSNSIREKGIIQPILVRKSADGDFEIIAGERRWRAAQLAGLKEVPALLKNIDEQELLELALIENIQRENLNAIEEAEAYDFLMKKHNLTQQDLAQKVGKDRVTVANMLRILNLQPGVRQMVSRGELSLGQAKVLLGLSDPKQQQEVADKAKKASLSVRALEKLIAKTKVPAQPEAALDARAKAAIALGEELQKLIGSKVNLDYDKGKGRIVIHFYSDSELNQVADTLRDSWRK